MAKSKVSQILLHQCKRLAAVSRTAATFCNVLKCDHYKMWGSKHTRKRQQEKESELVELWTGFLCKLVMACDLIFTKLTYINMLSNYNYWIYTLVDWISDWCAWNLFQSSTARPSCFTCCNSTLLFHLLTDNLSAGKEKTEPPPAAVSHWRQTARARKRSLKQITNCGKPNHW